jgi:hypothetical protein
MEWNYNNISSTKQDVKDAQTEQIERMFFLLVARVRICVKVPNISEVYCTK